MQATQASFDGNSQNGGIRDYVRQGGKILGLRVSATWLHNHEVRIAKYGDRVQPAPIDAHKGITPLGDGTYCATAEALDADNQCAQLDRNYRKGIGEPPAPGWEKLLQKVF